MTIGQRLSALENSAPHWQVAAVILSVLVLALPLHAAQKQTTRPATGPAKLKADAPAEVADYWAACEKLKAAALTEAGTRLVAAKDHQAAVAKGRVDSQRKQSEAIRGVWYFPTGAKKGEAIRRAKADVESAETRVVEIDAKIITAEMPTPLAVGGIGKVYGFKVIEVIDGSNARAYIEVAVWKRPDLGGRRPGENPAVERRFFDGFPGSRLVVEQLKEPVWLSGIDTSKMADGAYIPSEQVMRIVGTKASGARTFFELQPFSIAAFME